MRRIARLLTVIVAFALVQGCGTTNRNKAVVSKPGQAGSTESSVSVVPSSASSKGGTTAKPGTVTVDLYGKGTTAQSAPTPAPVKKEEASATPPPVKKEVVKAEPKPATPAKVEKPKPAPAPNKEMAKSTQPAPESTIAVSPYSSKGGSAAKPGTVTVNLSQGTSTAQPPTKTPPPPKKEKPAPVKKEFARAEPKPKPIKEAPKKEAPKKETPRAEKPMAKVEPAKPAAKKAPVETAAAKPGVKVGMVSQVNNEYKFIVIEFDSEKPLPVGSTIQIVRGGKVVAKARLEEPLDHWPLATATVIEGTPEKADSVSQ